MFLAAGNEIPLDVVFVDGVSSTTAKVLHNAMVPWVERHQTRALESSSSKIEKRPSRQNTTIVYRTILSWKLSEFRDAFVHSHDHTTTNVYDQCLALFEEEFCRRSSAPPTIADSEMSDGSAYSDGSTGRCPRGSWKPIRVHGRLRTLDV